MKLVGIAGSIADQSYNRTLLNFMAKHFEGLVDLEVLDIDEVPMFNEDDDQTNSEIIQNLKRKIQAADGIVIATPEHNHTIPAALKNVIEWLSYQIHPLDGKPVMIVGASYHTQGSSRAQLHLRQILEAPGVNAIVLPGNEFLLGDVKSAFDENGDLKDERTTNFLQATLQNFIKFARVINMIDNNNYEDEDLSAKTGTDTTIKGVDMNDDDWFEKASEKVNAVDGNAYVKLDSGLLTVNQLNYFLKTIPIELTYVDENNQFIYYNRNQPTEKMLAERTPAQVGDSLDKVHPATTRIIKHVKQVINALRTGKTDLVSMPVPGGDPEKHHVMHYYKAMHDEENNYKGVNEWAIDLKPIVDQYLKETGQKLVKDPDAKVDAMSGASEKPAAQVDATSGASEEEKPAVKPEVDATSSASKH